MGEYTLFAKSATATDVISSRTSVFGNDELHRSPDLRTAGFTQTTKDRHTWMNSTLHRAARHELATPDRHRK